MKKALSNLERLLSYNQMGKKLGTKNIRNLLSKLNNPQNDYKIIHIAGTNGKGSTASILEAVLREAKQNVGKYTSPYLVKINENIVFNGVEISDEELEKHFLIAEQASKKYKINLTFFEMATTIMFLYFKEKKIDYLILEVGMGGRLDATNVVTPVVSVITNVSYDHTKILGPTIKKIAKEKAGIIKKNIPVYFADEKKEVQEVIKKKTALFTNVLQEYNYDSKLDTKNFKTVVEVEGTKFFIPLYGEFQAQNFLLAFAVLKYLGVDNRLIKSGVKKTKWEGRFEIVKKNPFIILDGAHNQDSAQKLCETLKKTFRSKKILLISSILKDKEIDKIFKIFSEISQNIVFIPLNIKRGISSEELYKKGKKYFNNARKEEKIEEAINYGIKEKYEIIIITGSLHLIGEYKKRIFIK